MDSENLEQNDSNHFYITIFFLPEMKLINYMERSERNILSISTILLLYVHLLFIQNKRKITNI